MNNGKHITKENYITLKRTTLKDSLRNVVVNRKLFLLILLVFISLEVANGIFRGSLF